MRHSLCKFILNIFYVVSLSLFLTLECVTNQNSKFLKIILQKGIILLYRKKRYEEIMQIVF